MKLKSIRVTNFRAIRGSETVLSFDGSDIIFLLGQNNTGKTATLAAYEYLVAPKQKALLSDFHGFSIATPICIQATFQREDGDAAEFKKKGLDKWVDANGLIHFEKVWVDTEGIGQKRTFDPATGKYEDNGFGGLETHFTRQAPTPIPIPAMPSPDDLDKWVNDTFKKIVLAKLKIEEAEAYDAAQERIAHLRDRVYSNSQLGSLSSKANKTFQKVFPQLELSLRAEEGSDFDINKVFDKTFSVTIRDPLCEKVNQSYRRHGDGVVRQAMFNFLGIVKNDLSLEDAVSSGPVRKQFLLLFEEPEVYLHPSAVKRLRDVLYELCTNSPFQFLCASHSPSLIDLAKPQTSLVRVVRNSDGNTAFHQVGFDLFASDAERKQWVHMISRFNPHVCESFFADRVVVVEGDTEAIVAREFLGRIMPKHDLFVLNAGSKNNIPFFQDIFTHFRIKHYVIHDSDCRYQYLQNGARAVKSDGQPKANSAWALNKVIAERIEASQQLDGSLAARFVCISNFESAHGYSFDPAKGKPLSAFEYACNAPLDQSVPFAGFMLAITGHPVALPDYSQAYLEATVQEPDGLAP